MIWSVNPNLSPADAQQVLFDSSFDLGVLGWDQYYGWGRIDSAKAVELALKVQSIESPVKSRGKGK